MGEKQREKINLSELTERELLLLVNQRVEALEEKCEHIEETNEKLMLKVNTIETKSKVWGAMAGAVGFVFSILVEWFINRK